jgi:hypothetical protein
MQLRYYVPFKAQEGTDAQFALKEKLINIEGTAIDTSVNANKWQVPVDDLDYVVQSLQGAQLRVDHAESALMIIGKVPEAKRLGDSVYFRAEVGEEKIIEKILRNYVTHVSIQVDSDDVECSKCKRPTRKDGMLVHLCPGAWEIVHKPKVRELSIVASPAYENTKFTPVGFAAAMDASQNHVRLCEGECVSGACANENSITCRRLWSFKYDGPQTSGDARVAHFPMQFSKKCHNLGGKECLGANAENCISRVNGLSCPTFSAEERARMVSQLLKGNEDVGSRQAPQEPENKKKDETKEVKPLSAQDAQAKASLHQAQGVVNVAPGESAPKQVEYEDFMNQIVQLKKQMGVSAEAMSDAELDDLTKKLSDLEGEVARRSKKAELSKKIAELSKKLAEPESEAEEGEAEGAEAEAEAEAEEGEAEAGEGKRSEAKKRASGQGIVALDEVQKDALGNYDWFKDLLKAHKKLLAFK